MAGLYGLKILLLWAAIIALVDCQDVLTPKPVTTQAPPPPPPYCVYDATPNAGGFTIQILENSTHGNYNVEIGNVLMGEFSYPKNSSFEVKNLMPCTTYKHNVIYMGPNGNETSCDRTETTIKTREILKQDIQIVSCQPGSICYKSDWDIPKTAISTSINIPVESCGNEFCVKPRFDDICKTFTTTFKSGDCGKPVNLTQNIPIDFLNPRDIKPDFQNKIPVDIKPKLPPMCDNRTLTVDYTCQNGGLGQTKKPEELEPETDYTCIGQIKTANKTSPFPLRINCSIMIHKRHDAVTNKSISYTWDTKSDNCATIVPDLTYTCNCSEEKDKKNFHSVPVQQVAASGRTCDVAGLKPYTDYTCSIQPVYKTTLIHSGAVKYNERTQFGKPDQIDSLKVNLPEHNVIRVTCSYPTPKSKSFHGPEKIFIAHLNGGKELKSKKCDFEFKDLSYSTSYKLEVFAFNGKLLSNPREQHVTTYYNDKAVIGFLVFLIILTSVALILVVYKIFILRRRRSQDIGENMMLIQTANDEESLMPVDPIAAELLLDAYKRKFADEGRLFLAEFQSIPRIFSRYTVKEAKKQHNTVKNRYVDILPYDYDRVQLTTGNGEAGSDYINASFIDGYKESKKYIAAQGPKEETISDFWRMVWEQQSSIIVMVTRCEEGNRAKCAQYWPSLERETEIYDEFIVKLKSEDKCPDYTIRHLNITNKRDKASEREVTHIQFMSWPDHGVPGEPHLLLKLRRRVNAFKNFFSGPVVVHCSAGVGRTGTYIAIDAMMECLEAEGRLDIYGYVVRLRRQRCLMVQVEAQYILIHQAMLEQIQFGETEVTVSELHSTLNTLRQQSSEDEATLMEDEFERLPTFKNWRTFNTGSMEENKKKNRDSSVVPYDYNRVSLKMDEGRSHESDPSEEDEEDYSDEDDDESSKYINASHIDGYWGPHSFIVAQTPLPDTTEDFWTMVYQNRASTIVMLSDCSQGDEESDCVYWGKDKETFGDFEVELVSTEVHPTYISRNMLLRHVKRKDSRTLKQFQFLKWGSGEVPENPQDLPDLVKDIKEGQNSERTMSMVVHCNDGSTRSGVFCALWNLLDSAETEKLVDVFQVVKTLRKERLRMLSSLEQYQFLYEALDGVFPVQNGEVKPVQTSQSDSVQVVDETKAAAAAAERPASTTSSDQQAAPAAAATNTDGGDAGKKEEEVQKPDTATAPADSGDGVTVTVEV